MSGYGDGGDGVYGMMDIRVPFIDSLKHIALPTISTIKNKFLNNNNQDEREAILDSTKIPTKTIRVYGSTLNHRIVGHRGISLKTLITNSSSTHSSDAQCVEPCYDSDDTNTYGLYLGQA